MSSSSVLYDENLNELLHSLPNNFMRHAQLPELDKLLDERFKERVERANRIEKLKLRAAENDIATSVASAVNSVPEYLNRDETIGLSRYFNDIRYSNYLLTIDTIGPSIRESRYLDQPLKKLDTRNMMTPNLLYLHTNRNIKDGEFHDKYARRKSLKMITDIPGYKSKLPPCMTSPVEVNRPGFDSVYNSIMKRRLQRKAAPPKRDPIWPPLSVEALMEYGKTKNMPEPSSNQKYFPKQLPRL